MMIDRHLDDFGRDIAADRFEAAGDIDPVEKDAPILRSVTTFAFSRSASLMRAFQASRSRETRPARITGCLASCNNLAAWAMVSASGALVTGGMKRWVSIGGTGSASFSSCMPASRLT